MDVLVESNMMAADFRGGQFAVTVGQVGELRVPVERIIDAAIYAPNIQVVSTHPVTLAGNAGKEARLRYAGKSFRERFSLRTRNRTRSLLKAARNFLTLMKRLDFWIRFSC